MQSITQLPTETNVRSSGALVLAAQIEIAIKSELDSKLQKNLAELVNMLPLLAKTADPVLDAQAKIAADALLTEVPNEELAEIIIKRLSERLRVRNSLMSSVLRDGSPAVTVVLGLAVLLYFVIPISFLLSILFSKYETVFNIKLNMLGLVAFSGALGSIVSILVRLHQFAGLKSTDKHIFFFTGLFKPIVGMGFAFFIFTILSSGLIPVAIQTEKTYYFFAALSFVAGFSERFAQDVVNKTEATLRNSG